MQENTFIKVYQIQDNFEVVRDSLNKKQKYLLLPDHQLAEKLLILVSVSTKGQKSDKSEFVTKFVRAISTIFFT